MSRTFIPKELRGKVAEHARHRCGYCLTSEAIVGYEVNVEHIIPEAAGGPSDENNLWLSCSKCNLHKADKTHQVDPETKERVTLFNPRHQDWSEHFEWSKEGEFVIGKTLIGRATVIVLHLNRPILVTSRQLWVKLGLHPPKD